MNKQRYLAELRRLLVFMTEADKDAAVERFSLLFDAAGTEGEQALVDELGSPTKAAIGMSRKYAPGKVEVVLPPLPEGVAAPEKKPAPKAKPEDIWSDIPDFRTPIVGDEEPEAFSFSTREIPQNRAVCYLTYTNERTHAIIRAHLDRSPIYSGVIEGVGPRYCPSIETKIVTFPDKERHQLFIEPMGLNTEELYIQGLSSSLPEDVQIAMVRTIPGLRHAELTRPAYAIEYDCLDPTELYASLASKKISGLFGAGQFNGSSGYEEAAVQGFVAGVNAARYVKGQDPLILRRSDGYIGTLIDDLVTKGTEEPYRMMTSRSEYRLIHRQDNADIRLSHIGYALGLVSPERHQAVLDKYAAVDAELERLKKNHVCELLKRPENSYASLADRDPDRPALPAAVIREVEISVKYEGYIRRQLKEIETFSKMESRPLPADIDYAAVPGIRTEAKQKLAAIRPASFGQAGRISGVSPADLTALMIFIEKAK